MGLHSRKLTDASCQTCPLPDSCSFNSDCYHVCSGLCYVKYGYIPPAYSDKDDSPPPSKHHKVSTSLIIPLSILAAAFFAICCYAIYARFFSGRYRSRTRRASQPQSEEIQNEFLDEEHGPVVDHPIWYIRTTGLQQSIISAITVCRYKRGEGLIEGTECSVCLCEFQEDENLRLLPKCNHAFHLPCIDTWLRSHTNCPMCRAPIVLNPARLPYLEPGVVDSSFVENSQMEILENSRESSEGMENETPELRNGEEEEGQLEVEDGRRVCENPTAEVENMQTRRRSLSLDSSSATKINLALATVLSSANGNSNMQLGEGNAAVGSKRVTGNENLPTANGSSSSRTRNLRSAPTSMKRSRSNSWYGRSQRKPSVPLRSF